MAFIAYIILLLVININGLDAKVLYAWSQVIPENKLSVRAIINSEVCPTVYVDDKEKEMLTRSVAEYDGKYEKVCELLVPQNVKSIKIHNVQIPTLPDRVNKIAFIGDTGCRVNMLFQQECSSVESWPLKKNLDSITLHKPDLIVHIGDYHYRKAKCRSAEKCGNIYGYNPGVWYADWFEPAKNILLKSPLLFVRGNHESCDRAYSGWFSYLDPHHFSPNKCSNFTPSWFLDVGSIRFFIFDSSYGNDLFSTQSDVNSFREQFELLVQNNSGKPTWFLTHRPLWRIPKKKVLIPNQADLSQIEAFGDKFPDSVKTIVSGHIHIAQVLLMNGVPDQVIVGNGGALLHAQDQNNTYRDVEFSYSNRKQYLATEVKSFFGFGFAILDLDDRNLTFYNQNNEVLYLCQLTEDFKMIR